MHDFTDVDLPSLPGTKYSRYNASDKGRVRTDARRSNRPYRASDAYLTRPFVAWDGEGLNEPDGSHTYFLETTSGVSVSPRFCNRIRCLSKVRFCIVFLIERGSDCARTVPPRDSNLNLM